MSSVQKTPISILNELCMQSGEVLIYEDVPHETNPKMFACKVEAFNLFAIGSGRSKKLAKHYACEALIGQLKQQKRFADKLSTAPSNIRTTNTKSTDESNVSDAVDILRNICVQRKWPLPKYKEWQAYGEPHKPIFTALCELSSIKRTGTASKKSTAKQLAFRAILDVIQNFPQNEEHQQLIPMNAATEKSETQPEPPKFQTYRELIKLGIKPTSLRLRNRHKFFHRLPQEDRAEARQILFDHNRTSKEKIELACETLKLNYNIFNAPIDTNEIKDQKIFVLDGKHDCVIFGETESDLYENVIDHFKIMLNLNEPIVN